LTNCLSCSSGNFLDAGVCGTTCSAGVKYMDEVYNKC
jgi:hypothetical protein